MKKKNIRKKSKNHLTSISKKIISSTDIEKNINFRIEESADDDYDIKKSIKKKIQTLKPLDNVGTVAGIAGAHGIFSNNGITPKYNNLSDEAFNNLEKQLANNISTLQNNIPASNAQQSIEIIHNQITENNKIIAAKKEALQELLKKSNSTELDVKKIDSLQSEIKNLQNNNISNYQNIVNSRQGALYNEIKNLEELYSGNKDNALESIDKQIYNSDNGLLKQIQNNQASINTLLAERLNKNVTAEVYYQDLITRHNTVALTGAEHDRLHDILELEKQINASQNELDKLNIYKYFLSNTDLRSAATNSLSDFSAYQTEWTRLNNGITTTSPAFKSLTTLQDEYETAIKTGQSTKDIESQINTLRYQIEILNNNNPGYAAQLLEQNITDLLKDIDLKNAIELKLSGGQALTKDEMKQYLDLMDRYTTGNQADINDLKTKLEVPDQISFDNITSFNTIKSNYFSKLEIIVTDSTLKENIELKLFKKQALTKEEMKQYLDLMDRYTTGDQADINDLKTKLDALDASDRFNNMRSKYSSNLKIIVTDSTLKKDIELKLSGNQALTKDEMKQYLDLMDRYTTGDQADINDLKTKLEVPDQISPDNITSFNNIRSKYSSNLNTLDRKLNEQNYAYFRLKDFSYQDLSTADQAGIIASNIGLTAAFSLGGAFVGSFCSPFITYGIKKIWRGIKQLFGGKKAVARDLPIKFEVPKPKVQAVTGAVAGGIGGAVKGGLIGAAFGPAGIVAGIFGGAIAGAIAGGIGGFLGSNLIKWIKNRFF